MTQGKLSGKVALVTGAASGIGQGIAVKLAQEGAGIAVVDMNLDGANAVVKEIESANGSAMAVECDISQEDQVNKAIEEIERKLQHIGILVNCAGVAGYGYLVDLPTEEWRRIFEIHCNGTFYFSRNVVKSMEHGDRVINIASFEGLQAGYFNAHYAAAKAAVCALTRSLALEVAHKGITVNAIAPGVIRTPMGEMLIFFAPDFYKEIPAQRYGEPEDIAELTAFLASPGSGYITGQTIVIDGGLTLSCPVSQFTARMMGPQ